LGRSDSWISRALQFLVLDFEPRGADLDHALQFDIAELEALLSPLV